MKKNQVKELRGKKKEELIRLLQDSKNELVTLRLDNATRKLKNTRAIFHKRKDIAKILTTMKEKEFINE